MAYPSRTKSFHLGPSNYLPLLSSFHHEFWNTNLAGHMTDLQFKMYFLGTHSFSASYWDIKGEGERHVIVLNDKQKYWLNFTLRGNGCIFHKPVPKDTDFHSLCFPLCLVNRRHSLCGSQMRQTRKNIFGLSMLDLFLFLSIFSAEDQSRWNVPNNPPKGMCDPAICWRLLRLVRRFLAEIRCRHFTYTYVCFS